MVSKIDSERERLLCYASGILCAKLSHPGNVYSIDGLIPVSIRAAKLLIDTIYDDEKLKEILK